MAQLKLVLARLTPLAFVVITLGPDAIQTFSAVWWGK
jgi:hypothetical protein